MASFRAWEGGCERWGNGVADPVHDTNPNYIPTAILLWPLLPNGRAKSEDPTIVIFIMVRIRRVLTSFLSTDLELDLVNSTLVRSA